MLRKNLFQAVLFVLCLSVSTWGRADTEPMTREQLQEMYMTFLQQEGYTPKITEKGNVSFKFEGNTYLIRIAEKNPLYFSLLATYDWPTDTEEKRIKALTAANKASMNTKVAKTVIGDGFVVMDFQAFLQEPKDFRLVFKDSIYAVRYAVRVFYEETK